MANWVLGLTGGIGSGKSAVSAIFEELGIQVVDADIVAREVVEQAGINVDELLTKLVAAAGAEFTTFYYYTILRIGAIGMEGEGLKEIIEDARIEDFTFHAEW